MLDFAITYVAQTLSYAYLFFVATPSAQSKGEKKNDAIFQQNCIALSRNSALISHRGIPVYLYGC